MPSVATSPADAYGPVGRSAWLDIDWSAHQRWVEVGGRNVNLIDIGSGTPVMFLHGLSGCWQNWLENIPAFTADHRVIAIDLPGFGQSDMPAEPISVTGYARMLDTLCDELGIDRAVLVGNSMGGFVGAEMAIRFPRRVDRLCLVAAAGLSMEYIRSERRRGWRPRLENLMFFSLAWMAVRSDIVVRRPRLRRALLNVVAAHPERLPSALLAENMRRSGKPPGFRDALEAMTRYPIRDRLGEVRAPTLIVWGADDRLVPVGDATEFEWLIPDSRKLIYPDTGHLTMLERPGRFNADLRAFLEQPRAAAHPGWVHAPS
ncbi:MAG: alpha/beta fold hydrolase [Actinobacteria bacterium]|nr:alpha/beta fold hydrolase [Actinomycetota bacterium]